jgi:HAE1 family hydrophobic/amphiphilic exporter-1
MEMGKNRVRAAYDGTAEIGGTVTSITLVIVVVFFTNCTEFSLVSNIYTILCYCNYFYFIFIISLFYDNSWLSSRYGKLEHIEGKTFWKNYSWIRKLLNAFYKLGFWSIDLVIGSL